MTTAVVAERAREERRVVTPALRPYQHKAVARLREPFRHHRRVLFTLPTGGGKTMVFAHITARTAARGRRALVLVRRRELLCQASAKLEAFGVPHGCIAPGFPETDAPVQVGTVQTVARRLDRLERFDFVVLDEAHHAVAGTWRDVLGQFPEAHVPGVTAMPIASDLRRRRAPTHARSARSRVHTDGCGHPAVTGP